MLIVSYDISDNKVRTKFSKFLSKFGYRLQYSVFEIKNSDKILDNIICGIESNFAKLFNQSDSVIIFQMSKNCKITKYGYTKLLDNDIIII